MPRLTRDRIADISRRILTAAGASDSNAKVVADHLADANLTGHDSHGFIRIPQYVADIQEGRRDPKASPEVVFESGAIVRIDGHRSFGQVVAEFATREAMKRAREHGVGLATMGSLGHVGRIGSYGEMAAREGFASIMFTGLLGEDARIVAPFGGTKPRLSTNPVVVAFPYREDCPVLLDFATSIGAEGKLRVYRARRHQLPDEWVLDSQGKPSRDPNAFYAGGAVLPLGGLHGGHKGYALGFVAAVLGGIVGEFGQPEPGPREFTSGSTIVAIEASALGPLASLKAGIDRLVEDVKDTPLLPGHSEILFPGEKEAKTRFQRLKDGVDIEQATWDQIAGLAAEYSVAVSP
jgi:LDH2 family malate/lactate/ureidoglycolate dehydrogenase